MNPVSLLVVVVTVACAGCGAPALRAVAPVPAPAPTQVSGRGGAPPGLSRADVDGFLRAREREVRQTCWEGTFGSTFVQGDVEYSLVVDPSGAVFPSRGDSALSEPVAEVTSGADRTSSPALARCVSRVVDGWTFPRATLPTWVLLSFRFEPVRPASAPNEGRLASAPR